MRHLFLPFLAIIFSAPMALPLSEIDHFALVYETIKEIYVDEIDEKTLMNYAIEGLIQRLDPHSDYLSGTAVTSLEQATEGLFGGLGFELSPSPSGIEIMSVSDSSPASDAKLQSHDMILMIDGTLTQGMPLREAREKIRGPVGSTVRLTILPAGQTVPIEKTIERAAIKNPSIQARIIDDRWGYIRINSFVQSTGPDFIQSLQTQLSSNIHGVVLDLRNNPGGLVTMCADVANAFLDEKKLSRNTPKPVIVTARGRNTSVNIQKYVQGADITGGIPVVVLINQGSASASEIVAGALQDYGRAIIVGERSFGKGSVQTIIPIENNLLKMTISRYYTPKGHSIQASGIEPDIIISGSWVQNDEPSISISESNLNRHLARGETKSEPSAKNTSIQDPILDEGIRILKALAIQGGS